MPIPLKLTDFIAIFLRVEYDVTVITPYDKGVARSPLGMAKVAVSSI